MINYRYNRDIENGTVPNGLTSSSEFSFPINTSDVAEELPGSTSSTQLNTGVDLVSIDLSKLTIVVAGDWTNRRVLQNDTELFITRNSLEKKFRYVRVQPDYSLLTPTTKIFLDPNYTLSQDLFDFIGTAGAPNAEAKVILGDRIQNPFVENPLSRNLNVTKEFDNVNYGTYNVTFSWINTPEVVKNVLRWRPSPQQKRETNITYDVINSGDYLSQISLSLGSDYGSGAAISSVNKVTRVEVIQGGTYDSPVSVEASSAYGSGASFSVSMTGSTPNMSIESVTVTQGGTGYIFPPSLTIKDSLGNTGNGVIRAYIGIDSVETLSPGVNYVISPQVSISGTTGSTGSTASISANVEVFNTGQVDYVKVESSGSGYADGETLSFAGGGGTGTRAIARVDNGQIYGIEILDKGYGFTGNPTATVNTLNGVGASLSPIVTLYENWNYVYPDVSQSTESVTYTVSGLLKNVEYEWQLFSSTADKNEQTFNSPRQRFKFF